MKPYWSDDHLTLYGGDCRTVLAELPAESVHCVVTSPPYWGLRDYGTATWDGGDEGCDHRPPPATGSTQNKGNNNREAAPMGLVCRCGARRIDSQLGLEPTPEEYVANMVAVFREVRRVLRADGTLWLNLGDSYSVSLTNKGGTNRGKSGTNRGTMYDASRDRPKPPDGLKPKDLVGIPWRVAFALQADGWYLRSDIIWAKPNPMPESVTDRPTKAHEYLFLLSKSPRYFWDAEAVREGVSGGTHGGAWNEGGGKQAALGQQRGGRLGNEPESGNRNLRSVWTIATEPYPGAHFATFPRKLVEPCVKAGTSERGVCPECGAPWVRVVELGARVQNGHTAAAPPKYDERRREDFGSNAFHTGMQPGMAYSRETTGWRPFCSHDAAPVPAVCLDPFAGSGTTLLVAQALGRRGIGIDLSPDYLKQALARNAQTPLGLVG